MEGKMPRYELASAVYLGLGSNLGDRRAMLQAAVERLRQRAEIIFDEKTDAASLFESSPVDVPSPQPAYWNSVIHVRTSFSPHELLNAMLVIERSLGRVRTVRNAPRTIDVDLLLYDSLVLGDDFLTIPHPRMLERRFVMEPLVELAAGMLHPVVRISLEELASRIRRERVRDRIERIMGPRWVLGSN